MRSIESASGYFTSGPRRRCRREDHPPWAVACGWMRSSAVQHQAGVAGNRLRSMLNSPLSARTHSSPIAVVAIPAHSCGHLGLELSRRSPARLRASTERADRLDQRPIGLLHARREVTNSPGVKDIPTDLPSSFGTATDFPIGPARGVAVLMPPLFPTILPCVPARSWQRSAGWPAPPRRAPS